MTRVYDRQATEDEIAEGYVDDDSEDGICLGCKEHCSSSYDVSEDGEIDSEARSSCCGCGLWLP